MNAWQRATRQQQKCQSQGIFSHRKSEIGKPDSLEQTEEDDDIKVIQITTKKANKT